jgi:hypothetical protein
MIKQFRQPRPSFANTPRFSSSFIPPDHLWHHPDLGQVADFDRLPLTHGGWARLAAGSSRCSLNQNSAVSPRLSVVVTI